MTQPEVVVLSGVRTAIGDYGGGLKDKPPTELGAAVVREAVKRAGIQPAEVGHVVFGNVIHTDVHDMYLARVAAINGGLPVETPALTLNRLCGSGLQAIVSAAQTIYLGDTKVAIGGGAEVMSRSQYWVPGARWGQRMGDGKLIDAMVGALSDPFDDCHMGVTAENVAAKWGITRQAQDELALQSHQRALAAIKAGYFKEQILPIESKVKGQTVVFDTDEHPKETSLEKLAKLRPAFKGDGSVTAGNSSGINDAAAAVVLMEANEAQQRGLKPMGRLVAYAHAGVEPKYMGIGPIPAVRKVLERARLDVKDMDVIELNEAFAAQALAVIRDLDLPLDRTRPGHRGYLRGHVNLME
ncbi:MAG: acetyl-CoA C-acyltransferase [Chloroflexi bacterium]|nr:MAG: acetyl-CoA C-acyltransferase [Chloroflexota bacterium]